MHQFDWVALAVAAASVAILRLLVKNFNKPKFFPGPLRFPIIGNVLQMPVNEPWVTYKQWQEVYGDEVYLEVMGQPVLVLNSFQSCVDILDKRAEMYSDRQQTVISNEMMGWKHSVVACTYDDTWRRHRKLIAQSFRRDVVKQFFPIQEREVGRFLGTLLTEPDQFVKHFRSAASRTFLLNLYGIEVKTDHDPIITTAEMAIKMAVIGAQPGNFLVDFIPALKYIPSWFPGAAWKRFGLLGKEATDKTVNIPFNKTIDNMKNGIYDHSFVSHNLEKKEDPFLLKWCATTLLMAGTDTSVASIHNFFLSMTLHPDAQKRAQSEIDAVIGSDRLPNAEDRDALPYVNALVREVIRWQPVSPLALPHLSMKDDIYKGRFIPAGTIILANNWAISQNPEYYDEPEKFKPERFIPMFDKGMPYNPEDIPLDPMEFGFGYGRRVCAGIHYAEAMLFISCVRVLATFDITMAKDETGSDIVPNLEFSSSLVRETLPFKCRITPRSEAARALVVANSSIGL